MKSMRRENTEHEYRLRWWRIVRWVGGECILGTKLIPELLLKRLRLGSWSNLERDGVELTWPRFCRGDSHRISLEPDPLRLCGGKTYKLLTVVLSSVTTSGHFIYCHVASLVMSHSEKISMSGPKKYLYFAERSELESQGPNYKLQYSVLPSSDHVDMKHFW